MELIVNPRARQLARDPDLVARLRRAAGPRVAVHVTRDEAALEEAAQVVAARTPRVVFLAGGDGSLMTGLNALLRAHRAAGRTLPPIAPIPAGTAGTIARNWGIVGPPAACLSRMVEGPLRITRRPTLRVVAHQGGAAVERLGFIVGTGLVARFFRIYYARGAPGYAGSARLVARIFAESFVGGPLAREVLDPLPCTLEVNGKRQRPEAWSLVCCSVVRDLGIHMLLTYRAGEDPARPHLVATPMPPGSLGPRAPLVLTGRSIGGPDLVDDLVDTITIRFPDVGPWVLDGELLEAERADVSAGPPIEVASP